jgi:hypothetical protein
MSTGIAEPVTPRKRWSAEERCVRKVSGSIEMEEGEEWEVEVGRVEGERRVRCR